MPMIPALRAARLALAGTAALALAACGNSASQPQAVAAPVVQIHEVHTEPFTIERDLPGRIEAVRVAQVRARVAGIVLERRYVEGADVQQGDVLFRIDPAPFEAERARAQGELARLQAQLGEADALVRRYGPLVKIEAVSRQDYDNAVTSQRAAQAAVVSARAALQAAQLNLDHATVRAPIAGRIGRAMVTEGALVGQGETTLMTTIQQIDRVYADFVQPASEVLNLRAALDDGRLERGDASAARVSVRVDGSGQPVQGRLLFSDISVDPGTGQLSLRGELDNPQRLLLPGMYVRVRLEQGVAADAVLIPQRAVQRNSAGQAHVLVVGEDNVATRRPVETGRMHEGRWHIVQGLAQGDRVVTGGAARPGQAVKLARAPQSTAAR